jgi:hypothetical protein
MCANAVPRRFRVIALGGGADNELASISRKMRENTHGAYSYASETKDDANVVQGHFFDDHLNILDPYLGFEHFELCWHTWDLFLFHIICSYCVCLSFENVGAQIKDWSRVPLCMSEGSSYIRGQQIISNSC